MMKVYIRSFVHTNEKKDIFILRMAQSYCTIFPFFGTLIYSYSYVMKCTIILLRKGRYPDEELKNLEHASEKKEGRLCKELGLLLYNTIELLG